MTTINRLSNGLTLIVEEIPHVESVAYELLIPGGMVCDQAGEEGSALVLAELTSRGAGKFDSRGLSEAFENLGIRHGEGADHERYSYRAALLAENLGSALELTALMVREPSLPQEQIESIQSVLLQDLASLIDHPSQRAGVELNARYYPPPHNRSGLGTESGIKGVTRKKLEAQWRKQFAPSGAVLSIAGKVTAAQALKYVEQHFGSWKGEGQVRPAFGPLPDYGHYHIEFDSAQLQLMIAYRSEKFGGKHYYEAKVATGILSGGMFGRLFIEVREKRGLCYSVSARHSSTSHYGTVGVYAGTTAERAHETLAVTVKELRGLSGSVSAAELGRAKANLSAALIISEESSSSRASSNASDWWVSGTLRTLEQIQAGIDAVTIASIEEYLNRYPVNSFASLTLGARKLDMNELIN